MRRLTLAVCWLLFACLAVSPLHAQNRGSSGSGDAGRGAPAAAASVSVVPSVSGPSYPSYSTGSYSPAPIGNRAFGDVSGNSGYETAVNLQGTSFRTYYMYSSWNDYYSYLYRYYNLNPVYFTRFYRNREPLMTPAMLRLTLRQPLFLSARILAMIDQLETMYRDFQAGKTADKEAIIEKSREIRKLAKLIRGNRTLALIDIREKTDIYNANDFTALNPESIAKLREMALDLNRQLTDMAAASSSSTISVESYREHSFESISKGIEKACKAIENSSKQL